MNLLKLKLGTYLVLTALFPCRIPVLLLRRDARVRFRSRLDDFRLHGLKEVPVWRCRHRFWRLCFAGWLLLGCALLLLLILSLLCLTTALWSTVCLVLLLLLSSVLPMSTSTLVPAGLVVWLLTSNWFARWLLSSVRSTRLVHCLMNRSNLLKL